MATTKKINPVGEALVFDPVEDEMEEAVHNEPKSYNKNVINGLLGNRETPVEDTPEPADVVSKISVTANIPEDEIKPASIRMPLKMNMDLQQDTIINRTNVTAVCVALIDEYLSNQKLHDKINKKIVEEKAKKKAAKMSKK